MSYLSVPGSKISQAVSTNFSAEETELLGNIKDPAQKAQMEAQLKLQKYQAQAQFISNIMRIHGDIQKSINQNIR